MCNTEGMAGMGDWGGWGGVVKTLRDDALSRRWHSSSTFCLTANNPDIVKHS